MKAPFQKILIPVDFTINTTTAIRKACELAGQNAALHLLYVQCYGYPLLSFDVYRFIRPKEKKDRAEAEQNLKKWVQWIEEHYDNLTVTTGIETKRAVQEGIIFSAMAMKPDLIMIGKRSTHFWLPFLNIIRPEKIIRRTNIPVMIVKPGAEDSTPKKIIVPIDDKVNENKIRIIEAICKQKKVTFFLLAFNESGHPSSESISHTLSEYYQRIWFELRSKAECRTENKPKDARSILKIAAELKADAVIVEQGVETKMNWLNGQIHDYVPATSPLQILLVN